MNKIDNDITKLKNIDMNLKEINVVFKDKLVKAWSHNPNCHPYHSILYVISGEFLATINNKTYHIKKDEMAYIPANASYSSKHYLNPFSYIIIDFSFYEDEFLNYSFDRIYKPKTPDKYCNLFQNIEMEWNHKNFGYKFKTKMILLDILRNLYIDYMNESISIYGYDTIKESVKYIEKNYLSGFIDIKTLAEISDISRTHFIRVFKQLYNMTPTKYMNKLRIEKAIELLEHSPMSIYEIALKTGFSDPYYFSKIFKSITGISPKQYRSHK